VSTVMVTGKGALVMGALVFESAMTSVAATEALVAAELVSAQKPFSVAEATKIKTGIQVLMV